MNRKEGGKQVVGRKWKRGEWEGKVMEREEVFCLVFCLLPLFYCFLFYLVLSLCLCLSISFATVILPCSAWKLVCHFVN